MICCSFGFAFQNVASFGALVQNIRSDGRKTKGMPLIFTSLTRLIYLGALQVEPISLRLPTWTNLIVGVMGLAHMRFFKIFQINLVFFEIFQINKPCRTIRIYFIRPQKNTILEQNHVLVYQV